MGGMENSGMEEKSPVTGQVGEEEQGLPETPRLEVAESSSEKGMSRVATTGQAEGVLETKSAKPPTKRSLKRWVVVGLGALILLSVALLSSVGGYISGIGMRREAESTQVAVVAQEQYQLGVQDMQQGEFFRARQRFEYVIKLDPDYPGALDKLAEVLLALNTTATPTLAPTPTLIPTADQRGVQGMFEQAQQHILNSNWDSAIQILLDLRKADPAFRAVDVDGMVFLALRNRGRMKILNADLEGGIYDLTLAAKFGPMDAEAQGLLTGASLYITGASFWGIDWEQVVNYFQQIAQQYPGLMDGSKMTATERYRLGLFEYGNWLAGQGKACKAVEYYLQSLSIGYDPKVEQAGQAASKACAEGQKPTPTATP